MTTKKKPSKKTSKKVAKPPTQKQTKKPHKKPIKIKRISEESDPSSIESIEVISNAVPVVDNGMVIMTPKEDSIGSNDAILQTK